MSAAGARNRKVRAAGLLFIALLVGAAAVWRAPLANFFWRLGAPLMQARFGGPPPADPSRLAAAEAERDALYRENVELKSRLGRTISYERVLGAVLLKPPATPYDTLVIDAGSSAGVALGDIVSAGGTTFIGTVTDVYQQSARVTLYSAPGNSYDAVLYTSAGTSVSLMVEGQGGGSLRSQVPAGINVSVGDSALLPGVASGLIGTITAVDSGESGSFITVYFSLPVNVFMLRFVEVWKIPNDKK